MREHTDRVIRKLLSARGAPYSGPFAEPFNRFWINVEKTYAAIGHPSTIPEALFPVWLLLCEQQQIPMQGPAPVRQPLAQSRTVEEVREERRNVDLRTKEGRAIKEAASAGV